MNTYKYNKYLYKLKNCYDEEKKKMYLSKINLYGGAPTDLLINDINELNNIENPEEILSLTFGNYFNNDQPLGNSLNQLINLTSLTFGWNFDNNDQPLGHSLDQLINLQSLTFGFLFNQPLGNSLDRLTNLQSLNFGYRFNQPLGNSLDRLTNLQSLSFRNVNQPLDNMKNTWNIKFSNEYRIILTKIYHPDMKSASKRK
jgi:hypothetical protein